MLFAVFVRSMSDCPQSSRPVRREQLSIPFTMSARIIKGSEIKLSTESFGNTLYKSLKHGGSRVAIVDAITAEEATYNDLLQRSVSLARNLYKMGIRENEVISICSENTLHFMIPAIASLYLGTVFAPINPIYTTREITHALDLSRPKIMFCSATVLDTISNMAVEMKSIQKIIVLNHCENLPSYVIKMSDLVNLPLTEDFQPCPVSPDHTSAIFCSSGTTGLPKGVMVTHKNFQAALYHLRHPGFGNFEPSKIGLAILPFFHIYGMLGTLCMVAANMKAIVIPKFEEKLFLNTIQNYRVTFMTIVPPIVLFLSKHPLVDYYDLTSLNEIVCGAAPLSKEVQDAITSRLRVNIRQGYGLTELTLAATLLPFHIKKSGSIGVLVPGLECKVIDPETQKMLGPQQPGELLFRGPPIMKGYVRNKAATDATIDAEKWLHSGDIGYYDNDGYFFIVDRLKELIKYKGFQVPPAEIEGILFTHPEILDCGVVGKPDGDDGELTTAFIVKNPESTLTEKDIIKFVAENVSYHKRLHGGVIFVESIPKNPTGKILRRVLRERLSNMKSKL